MNYAYRLLTDRSEAEDVAQETFLRLWTHARQWTPQTRLSAWLHRVAHNLCIDRLRGRAEHSSERVERLQASDRPSTLVARRQVAKAVEEAVSALPERQRVAISLVHFQGLSNTEAAEIMDISVDALESLLARARLALRKGLTSVDEQTQGGGYDE